MIGDQGDAGGSGDPGGTSSDSSEGEDQDESSTSASNLNISSAHNALDNFRQQWQRELHISPTHKFYGDTHTKSLEQIDDKSEDVETRAKLLFLNGVEHERKGKLYEAIQFYRRAVQLVPDIEFKLYESSKTTSRTGKDIVCSSDDFSEPLIKKIDADDGKLLNQIDLYARFQRKIYRNHTVCLPQFEQKATHVSSLPTEIIVYILRWVVSCDLDLRSLELCSLVCRGFYICCRDTEIWRLACARVWGVNCGNNPTPYTSWREMYIERPRLQYNGCYISKTTYFRHGENSFQDQFYRPWHLVEYYRYLRFFPDGKVLMLTTSEEPAQSVGQLRYRIPRHASVLSGHYRLCGNSITLLVKRQDHKYVQGSFKMRGRRRDISVDDHLEQTFHLELQIQSQQKRRNVQLSWLRYSVFTRYSNGKESDSTFDLIGNRFPPLWFSRVKSYTTESENALQ